MFKWIVALILAFGLAWLHRYWLSKNEEFSKLIKVLLFSLRWTALTIVLVLLLNPLYELTEKKNIPNTATIIVDDSSSMSEHILSDSLKDLTSKIALKLSEKYELKIQDLEGQKVGDSLSFNRETTDLISAVETANRFAAQGGSSVFLLFSDGQINYGNKSLLNNGLNNPVYSVALGKEDVENDLSVKAVFHNKIGQVDVDYPVQIEVLSKGFSGRTCVTKLLDENGKLLNQFEKVIIRDEQLLVFDELLKSDSVGIQTYKVEVDVLDGEQNSSNNVREFSVHFKRSKKKVLLCYDILHPDVSAFKSVFRDSKKFELYDFKNEKVKKDLASLSFDAIVVMGKLNKKIAQRYEGVGRLIFAQSPSDFKQSVNCDLERFLGEESAQVSFNKDFKAFGLDSSKMKVFAHYPPLEVFRGDYAFSAKASVLGRQIVNGIQTDFPVVLLGEKNGVKEVFVGGNGVYKWGLWEAKMNQESASLLKGSTSTLEVKPFPYLMEKLLDYACLSNNKSRFEFVLNSTVLRGESVKGRVKYLDQLGKVLEGKEVKLQLKDSAGIKEFTSLFSEQSYVFDFGVLLPGKYKVRAVADDGTASTWQSVLVEDFSLEDLSRSSDYSSLKEISKSSGGQFFTIDKTDELINLLLSKELKTQSYYESFIKSLLDNIWLMLMLLLISVSSWSIRKWHGYY